jgi:hypothetical protein
MMLAKSPSNYLGKDDAEVLEAIETRKGRLCRIITRTAQFMLSVER